MTQQVRTGYRNHRKATWGLAIVMVIAIAAVVIPIASGAADKTYTMLFPASGAVTPTPPTTGNSATGQTLCTDNSYTSVRVQITNTAKSASLGSADVTFPMNVTLAGTPSFVSGAPTEATIARAGNVVSIRQLSLAKSGVVTISVALNTPSAAAEPQQITAVVKQSNDFNDSGQNPEANVFAVPATFPTLAIRICTATISGRVYHDRDESGAFAVGPGSATSDVPKEGWTVTLQRKTDATTYTTVDSDQSDANGNYSVTGFVGDDHRLCVAASSDDSGRPWGIRALAGSTLVAGCAPITSSSGTASQGLGVSALGSAGASGQDFAVVPITASDIGAGNTATSGDYVVLAAGNTSKDPRRYVQETWTDSDGRTFFTFAPINPCTSNCGGKIYLLESLTGSIKQTLLAGGQVPLKYDDTAPFQTFVDMPYCLQDPRPSSGNTLLETDVLPTGATSCIVEGHQEVSGDGTVDNALVDFAFVVYTSFDGSRGVG